MQISLNIIDILCLHIFFWIRGELIYVLSIVVYIPSTYNAPFWHKFNSSAFKKNIHAQQHNYEKFSPTTQQYSNIKIINKNFRFSKHYILETCNQHLIELIFKPVLTYLNVFSFWHYLQNYI